MVINKYTARYNNIGPSTVELHIEMIELKGSLEPVINVFVCIDDLDEYKLKKFPYWEKSEKTIANSNNKLPLNFIDAEEGS